MQATVVVRINILEESVTPGRRRRRDEDLETNSTLRFRRRLVRSAIEDVPT